jgi:caffeoyl-CoA O-methyltransferase
VARSDRTYQVGRIDRDYVEATSAAIHPALAAIEEAAEPEGIPILDRESGRVLAALAASRRRILEIGTAIGFSTLWMALAQPSGGTIVTIDPDRSRTDRARNWWRRAGVPEEQVTVVTARALEAFEARKPSLGGPFDLVFIDAIKTEYPAYAAAVIPRISSGALIVADNVLWSGRVAAMDQADSTEDTLALRQFNSAMLSDRRFVASILPVGDGLLVATYRG